MWRGGCRSPGFEPVTLVLEASMLTTHLYPLTYLNLNSYLMVSMGISVSRSTSTSYMHLIYKKMLKSES
jgi:hypothetical protein